MLREIGSIKGVTVIMHTVVWNKNLAQITMENVCDIPLLFLCMCT
jgi:hypothetical protein